MCFSRRRCSSGDAEHISDLLLRIFPLAGKAKAQLHDLLFPRGQLAHGECNSSLSTHLYAAVNEVTVRARISESRSSFRPNPR